MAVYLLLCVPLVFLFVVATAGAGEVSFRPEESRFTAAPAVKGALWFVPAYALILLSEAVIPLAYSPWRLFIYHVVHESAIPLFMGLIGALLFTRSLHRESDRRINIAMVAAFAGFYTVASVVDLLRESHFLDSYSVILLPTQRAVAAALVPLLVIAWRRESRRIRYLFAALIPVLPVILGLPGYLGAVSYDVAAHITAAATAVLSVAAYLLLYAATFPYRRPRETAQSEEQSSARELEEEMSSVPAGDAAKE